MYIKMFFVRQYYIVFYVVYFNELGSILSMAVRFNVTFRIYLGQIH